jgi:NADP-dependent 3-hydroxy acid dehydrogenase YdfG
LGSIEDDKVQKELIEKTVKKFGHIDVLINNAGVSHRSDLHPESAENLDYVLDVNLKRFLLNRINELFNVLTFSVVKLTQMAVPLLAKTTQEIL